ncbi:LamG-like jellyroll fold domain-containing protein [Thomasclavelia sp.]
MKNKYIISLLAAIIMTAQSSAMISASTILDYQTSSFMDTAVTKETLKADIFDVDFSNGPNDRSPLENQLGKTIGTPQILMSDELHKNIAEFDGKSAYLYPFSKEKYEKINENVTMECMVKFNEIPSGEHDIFSNQQAGGIGIGLNNGQLTFFAHVGGNYQQPVTSIKAGQWYHIVGVVEGKAVKLYVNGKLQSEIIAPAAGIKYPSSSSAWNMVLGGDSDANQGGQFFVNADLSFARIYGLALSDENIFNLNEETFKDTDIEVLKPQNINLGLVGAKGISGAGEWNLNLHANEDKNGSIDKIEYDLIYDKNILKYENIQHKMNGVTITKVEEGLLHISSTAALSTADFNNYSTTRLGKLDFKTTNVKSTAITEVKINNFKAYSQDIDVTSKMTAVPAVTKELKVYDKDIFDKNGDGVVGAGDIALADDELKEAIANEAAIYPYKHVVILTMDGAGIAWDPDNMYYASSNSVVPTKHNDDITMAKRKNTYAMDLLNKEFATSYTAKAVTPSISAQNYSSILHGVPWGDVPFEYQVTNDTAGQRYYADYGKENALYPSVFKAVNKYFPARQNAAFAEWTQILNGIIEPDAQVVTKGSASKQSFYDVANYIKSESFKNTAVVYMQSDWMDHVGHSTGYYNNTFWSELKQYDDYYKAVVDALKEIGEYDETLIITNADHGGSGTGHGSNDPSNMDIFIGMGGQTVASGKRLNGGNNADISPLALAALRIDKPASMTGNVFDQSAFLKQEELSKKGRDIENVTMSTNGKKAVLELNNKKMETRVFDAIIDLNGNEVNSIDVSGGSILRQDIVDGKLKLTISFVSQPTRLATINFTDSDKVSKLSEVMLGSVTGDEIYPDIKNKEVSDLYVTNLQIAVELASKITDKDLENVVPAVINEFKAALADAKAVLNNTNATQNQIDTAFDRLANVMHMLEFFKGNKTDLDKLIAQIEGLNQIDYSEASWNAMIPVLNEAREVIADENAMQKEVNETYTKLVTAFIDLRLKPNKDLLNDLINKANRLNKASYTAVSLGIVEKELAQANAVLNNPEATQEEVDKAVNGLTNAMAKLVTNSSNPTADADALVKAGDTKQDAVKTGDYTNLTSLTTLIGSMIIIVYLTKVKNKYIEQ